MLNTLYLLIQKYPMRLLFGTAIVLVVLVVGALSVSLNTGNDTLIDDEKQTYIDNQYYQEQFGGDPIILLIDSPSGYNLSSVAMMGELYQELNRQEGVFLINSPVSVFQQIGESQKANTIAGLQMMSNGLTNIGAQLTNVSASLNVDTTLIDDVDTMTSNLSNLSDAQSQLEIGLNSLFNGLSNTNTSLDTTTSTLDNLTVTDGTLEAEIDQIVTELTTVSDQLTLFGQQSSLSDIPAQTATALDQLITGLETLATTQEELITNITTMKNQLTTLATEFQTMATTLTMMSVMVESFEVGLPKNEEGLHLMLYEGQTLRTMFTQFLVDETTIRFIITPTSDITSEQMEHLLLMIDEIIADYPNEDVLVSGKPVLDFDIQSSMMDSMQIMMMSAAVMMVIVLMIVYPVRKRLLPILIIFMAVGATIGLMGWLNIGLTMVSMAVFPVLIGLGIDYSIQMQSRYEEVYNEEDIHA